MRTPSLVLVALLSAGIAAAPLAAQAPAGKPQNPPPPPPPKPAEPKKPDPIVDDTGVAANFAQLHAKELADKDPKTRADALALFAVHRNEAYVKCVAPLLADKDESVAKAAITALTNQPYPAAIDALLAFICDPKKATASDELRLATIQALGTTGLGKKGYDKLHELFPRCDDATKSAIFATFGKAKEKRAFSMLVDNFEEPGKGGAQVINAKKTWETWKACREALRHSLRDITGEGFPTAKQYIEWADGPGRKLGFTYEHGK